MHACPAQASSRGSHPLSLQPAPLPCAQDYTGASLYWNSQVAAFEAQLIENTYGNPHSGNPSSARTTAAVNQTRFDLLAIFGAAPDDYDLVYTRSATGALQVLGEAFPWTGARGRNGSYFVYLTTNHKSVVGE